MPSEKKGNCFKSQTTTTIHEQLRQKKKIVIKFAMTLMHCMFFILLTLPSAIGNAEYLSCYRPITLDSYVMHGNTVDGSLSEYGGQKTVALVRGDSTLTCGRYVLRDSASVSVLHAVPYLGNALFDC
jgi:hypothetical protein